MTARHASPRTRRAEARPRPSGDRRLAAVRLCLLAVTLGYLLFEVPFAALLLDTLAGHPSADDVERIERTGRMLSGIAVALAIAGFFLPRWMRTGLPRALAKTGMLAALVALGVFHGEKELIDALARGSSDAFRRDAAFATLAREEGRRTGRIGDLRLDGDGGLALRGLSAPILAFSGNVAPSVSDPLGTAARIVPDDALPDLRTFEDTVLRLAFARMAGDMRDNVSAKRSRGVVPGTPLSYVNEIFPDVREVAMAGIPYGALKTSRKGRAGAVGRGLPMPEGLPPETYLVRERFVRAALPYAAQEQRRMMDKALRTYSRPSREAASDWTLSYGDENEFARLPVVQGDLVRRVGVDERDYPGLIYPAMSAAAKKALHAAFLKRARAGFVASFAPGAPRRAFGAAGERSAFGESSARMAIVPLFALSLSLAGAFLHVGKATNFALLVQPLPVLRRGGVRIAVSLAVVGILGFLAWHAPASTSFRDEAEPTRADLPAVVAGGVIYANLGLQPGFYPVARRLGEIGPFAAVRPAIVGGDFSIASALSPVTVAEAAPADADESVLGDAAPASDRVPLPTPRPAV